MSWWDSVTNWMKGDDNKGGGAALVSTIGGLVLPQMGFAQERGGPVGYQGSIPSYAAVRAPVPMEYDPNRRPGSGGLRYFSDTVYAPQGGIGAAQTAVQEQATGLAALNQANPYREERPKPPVRTQDTTNMAAGGIAQLAKGRYLNGDSDGMADKVRANIDGVQEARLSDGEYVIPADVVSHLGNGNSEAGAKVLDKFMARVRKERTGNDKQGKQIDPMKMLPS